ncbi:MAG: 1-acyl-sn-glycerol-3-phosphate acyltransferase [Solirubrobacterales bacterium]|nr:1-acyl-sn-glycerol-3-phosphate acyltransferase [Solirubrobacterales bacterium]
MPPKAIRRPVTVTTWLVLSTACALASPLLLALARVIGALTGRRQPWVIARLIVAYFVHELLALIALGVLWVMAGLGRRIDSPRSQRRHWRLVGWFFGSLAAIGRRTLEIDVQADPEPEALRALQSDDPLIVFSRHAGPGDTIFIVDELLSRFHRRPSVAFKQTIALDPSVDLMAHRLPQAMLDTSDREECEAQITELTAELGRRGTFLLFPEGGNFTPERRRSALQRLWRKGNRRAAEQAERMTHVMPPQPGGALAALSAARDIDVVFAAHTGLGLAAYPSQFWRDMPIGRTLHTRMWLVPAADIPTSDEDRVKWLYDWWERIDRWIAEVADPHERVAR